MKNLSNPLGAALLLSLVILSFLADKAKAQQPASDPNIESLRRDMSEMIKGQLELQKQVQELKTLLQGNQACAQSSKQNISFNIAGAPVKGEATAPITMIEFSDFQCPFSAKYNNDVMPRLEQEYIRTGKVRYVFRDFPLQNIHALSRQLADTGRCALDQRKFWELSTQLFSQQPKLTADNIASLAGQAGLDNSVLTQCLDGGKNKAALSQQISEASADGVTGTPTFFLGKSTAGSAITVTRIIVGAQPYESFKQAIDGLLLESQKAAQQL